MTTEEKAALVEFAKDKINGMNGAVLQTAFGPICEELKHELKLAEIALAALTTEPVAVPDEYLEATQNDKGLFELSEDCMVRLAVALSRQQKGLVLKPGCKLVPVEPTAAMMVAGTLVSEFQEVPGEMYRAMIDAAPTP